ncbi:TIGR04086 family membrane protein [Paenibacillus guangzhouensis]|uniref:TIGR04086 family membrane protein n=1 Tax=Paenibacillus guangzhouensis TaxID=1473112 RepID=UPI001266C794|nr:TIGR04086 family membrane protein [Paenibacillus guangzhouensis]
MSPINRVSKFHISSPILSGLTYAFIWMMLGALALSMLLWLSGMQEENLPKYSYILHGFALFIGGMTSGRRAEKRGWYYGGLLGILYCLIIMLVSFLAYDAGFSVSVLVMLIASFSVAAIGGMLGVNMKRS